MSSMWPAQREASAATSLTGADTPEQPQKAQRRDTLAATQAQKDAVKAQREQKKQDEAAELESKHVLCET
ncbi:hypothetical protein T492DRAFT_1054773, partial [Pavlovales sp. CCMP2436]